MPFKKTLSPEILTDLVSESLKNNFVAMPNVPLSEDEARCYFEVTNATLNLHRSLNETDNLKLVTSLIKERNELLKSWQVNFGFKYPI